MDLPGLAVILQATLTPMSATPPSRALIRFQFQHTPQHLVRPLQIIVDKSWDLAVRQVASIHFKNFVAKHWSPHDPDEQPQISGSDNDTVRDHILVFVAQVPQRLRVQLGECLKTIIHADYPEQ